MIDSESDNGDNNYIEQSSQRYCIWLSYNGKELKANTRNDISSNHMAIKKSKAKGKRAVHNANRKPTLNICKPLS